MLKIYELLSLIRKISRIHIYLSYDILILNF